MKAVVLIDVQNDFVTDALGSEWAQSVVPKIVEFATKVSSSPDYHLFATRDTHSDAYLDTLEGKKLPVKHCVRDTEGWQLVPGLRSLISESDIDDKESFMSCYRADGTCRDLVDLIEQRRWERKVKCADAEPIEEIIVCGFVTSICVISNALRLRGAYPDVPITVFEDLCADIDKESHEAALRVMRNCQIEVKTCWEGA